MLNTVTLQGRLTAKPELRTSKNNKPNVSFSIAVDRNGKDAGTDFIQVVAWNKTAEFVAQYFDKGQPIIISGKLQSRTIVDKNTNKNRTVVDVVATQAYFAGNKPAAQGSSDEEPESFVDVEAEDEDMPL